jgi:hypothetical protein
VSTAVEPEALIEAMARLDVFAIRCNEFIPQLHGLEQDAYAARGDLRIAAFGDPPEADQDFVTDSIEVAIEARSLELRDEPDRALWVRQLGTLDA